MKFYHFNPSELDCVATESDRGRSVQPCGPTSDPPPQSVKGSRCIFLGKPSNFAVGFQESMSLRTIMVYDGMRNNLDSMVARCYLCTS